jgi:hypothetical protein
VAINCCGVVGFGVVRESLLRWSRLVASGRMVAAVMGSGSTYSKFEFVCRPLLFAIQCCKVEHVNRVMVVSSVLSIDYRIVAVDPHRSMIMRD